MLSILSGETKTKVEAKPVKLQGAMSMGEAGEQEGRGGVE